MLGRPLPSLSSARPWWRRGGAPRPRGDVDDAEEGRPKKAVRRVAGQPLAPNIDNSKIRRLEFLPLPCSRLADELDLLVGGAIAEYMAAPIPGQRIAASRLSSLPAHGVAKSFGPPPYRRHRHCLPNSRPTLMPWSHRLLMGNREDVPFSLFDGPPPRRRRRRHPTTARNSTLWLGRGAVTVPLGGTKIEKQQPAVADRTLQHQRQHKKQSRADARIRHALSGRAPNRRPRSAGRRSPDHSRRMGGEKKRNIRRQERGRKEIEKRKGKGNTRQTCV